MSISLLGGLEFILILGVCMAVGFYVTRFLRVHFKHHDAQERQDNSDVDEAKRVRADSEQLRDRARKIRDEDDWRKLYERRR